ncbi:hypothetical protein EV681_2295 [Advenella incenata]|jgi:hypothetical protein|uniref:Uncharacterized protein n=1 Tax=Advenella incenata TaxID=267800 RepID=A0A4Q7VVH0_9BURK|nr:hypothetical protein [Advenella incenata]RZU00485.1 hypothetical protein EV681_2295 [Advenella incenata]
MTGTAILTVLPIMTIETVAIETVDIAAGAITAGNSGSPCASSLPR